ncbi:MAG TPA: hypothetical protein VNY24_00545 [Candidatus Acidoferrales bacterium]|jgi:hypothetical protein|nr:hypothetical protein [Candidatus Acidoferrales bacterium]
MTADAREPSRQDESADEEIVENSPGDELGYAIADLLRTKEVAEAVKKWVEATAQSKAGEYPHARLQAWLAFAFGMVIFLTIAVLAWLKVLSGEVTAGLLGSLLGYWYGRQKSS